MCSVDGLAAEHFIYADRLVLPILSVLFNFFLNHGSLPDAFMRSAIDPIVKNKTGDPSDINNYRPIALVTAMSKVFEICILNVLELFCQQLIISPDLRSSTLRTYVYLHLNQ